ncbi:hypothetical protein EZS27_028878 [termite gut metagenome]|uniref:Uncharacterized protein n=1 Tax=termite gut metagenome TaxID=433724 RepID=A0A5J4QJ69_9ZZZZ
MYFDAGLVLPKLRPPENTQTEVYGCRVKSINVACYLEISFSYPRLTSYIYKMIGVLFEYLRLSSFICFGRITSGYTLAKARMIAFSRVCIKSGYQVSKAFA